MASYATTCYVVQQRLSKLNLAIGYSVVIADTLSIRTRYVYSETIVTACTYALCTMVSDKSQYQSHTFKAYSVRLPIQKKTLQANKASFSLLILNARRLHDVEFVVGTYTVGNFE